MIVNKFQKRAVKDIEIFASTKWQALCKEAAELQMLLGATWTRILEIRQGQCESSSHQLGNGFHDDGTPSPQGNNQIVEKVADECCRDVNKASDYSGANRSQP